MSQEFSENNQRLIELLRSKLSNKIKNFRNSCGDLEIRLEAKDLRDVVQILKLDQELDFDMLLSVTAIDFLDSDFFPRSLDDGTLIDERFDVVYHFLSLKNLFRLRIKIALSEINLEIATLTDLYKSANFLEREAWDMYGIKFKGHPDLRRILMYEEFKGHPLRKDYPVQGKQPRVKLRYPEVTNTARDMRRSELININKRKA